MAYFCYLLECADGSYYCGWSTDVTRRVNMHNKGQGARYTRTRRPVALVYVEEVPSHSQALRRERALKRKSHQQKADLAQQFQETPLE